MPYFIVVNLFAIITVSLQCSHNHFRSVNQKITAPTNNIYCKLFKYTGRGLPYVQMVHDKSIIDLAHCMVAINLKLND